MCVIVDYLIRGVTKLDGARCKRQVEVFRKRMYCIEGRQCWDFSAPDSDLAPGELCPLRYSSVSVTGCWVVGYSLILGYSVKESLN